MKRSLGFIVLCISLVGLNVVAHAQTPDTTGTQPKKVNPAKQAVRQLKMLQQQLNLTDDQVTQMQVILIHRDIALDSIRNNPSGDRKSDGRARRGINQDADGKINSLLTADQKPLYEQWKQEQREKFSARRSA
jgi:protein CpxP